MMKEGKQQYFLSRVVALVYGLLAKDHYRVKRNVRGHVWPCFVFHNTPVISLTLLFRPQKLPSVFFKKTPQ